MGKKRIIILVFLILVSSVFAINSDFNNDGKVDFDDFFLFADNFQKEVNKDNEKFDLDKNKKIDVEDFFIFADEFEKGKVAKSRTGLAKTVELVGDFDGSGCVDNKDLELANKELKIIYDQKARYSFSDIGNYPDDFNIKSDDKSYSNEIKRLADKYDLNNDGLIFSIVGELREDKVNLAKKDLELFNKDLGKGCAMGETGEVSTKPVDLKLLRVYHFDYEKFIGKFDAKTDRLKVNAKDIVNDKDSFEFSDEEYEAIAREDGFVAQSLGSNTVLFVFKAPTDAEKITVNYVLKSGHDVGYGTYLYPRFQDGFDTYAYKTGETRINFNGYGAGNGEVNLPVENGKAYLIADSRSQYYFFIDRIGAVQ